MPGKITRVTHRHGDQKAADAELVIEVGKPPPEIYQRPSRQVISIDGNDPLLCKLDDGDVIYIGKRNVREITRT